MNYDSFFASSHCTGDFGSENKLNLIIIIKLINYKM